MKLQFTWLAVVLLLLPTIGGADETAELDCVIEPRSIVDLSPIEEGMLVEILVGRGDPVRAGLPVARLDSDIQRHQLELARLRAASDASLRSQEAQLELRRVELKRAQGLLEKRVTAATQVEEAEIEMTLSELAVENAEIESALAQIEFAQARTRLARRTLKSPVDGVVVRIDGAPGEFAHEQLVIMRIAEIDPLHVEVFAPGELYGKLKVGQQFDVIPAPPINGRFSATVSVIDPVFDAASGTFGVRLELPNPDGAVPAGIRCKVQIGTS